MQTSETGKALIRQSEGLCLTIKPDNKGPQIGYGHDLTPAEIASHTFIEGITADEAEYLLDQDLANMVDPAVNRLAPQANQNQHDALASFCYNLGPVRLATMLHHGFDQAPLQMPAWVYADVDGIEQKLLALEARRAAEVKLFNTPC